MEYDCNKTLDCMHELKRVCDRYKMCDEGCPLYGQNCVAQTMTQTEIDILQKWSDENPEPPKLTEKDRMFLECFEVKVSKDRIISKDDRGNVFYYYRGTSSMLAPDMFKNLEPDTRMTFWELLEVEE